MATGRKLTGLNPLAYMGVEPQAAPQLYIFDSAPTSGDAEGYDNGSIWIVSTTQEVYMLMRINKKIATWNKLYPQTGGGGGTTTYPCDAGTATAADGSLDVKGGTNIKTTGSGNTLTFDVKDSIDITFDIDVGGATTSDHNLTTGTTGLTTTAGGLRVHGETNMDHIGTGILQTDATGKITAQSGNNGQLLISANGGDPAWATVTSGDATVTITPGPNSLNLRRASGGGNGYGFMAYQKETYSGSYAWTKNSSTLFDLGATTALTTLFDATGGAFFPGDGAGNGSYFEAPKAGSYLFSLAVSFAPIPTKGVDSFYYGPAYDTPNGIYFAINNAHSKPCIQTLTIGQKVYFKFAFNMPTATFTTWNFQVRGTQTTTFGEIYSTWVCGHYLG